MEIYNKTEYAYELKKEIITKTFEVKSQVTAEQLECIVVDGFESGITYWAGLDNTAEIWDKKPKDMPIAQYVFQLLINGETIKLYDIENEDDEWELDLEQLLNGISLNSIHRQHDCDLENMDSITCDCIIQYALFKDVIYG